MICVCFQKIFILNTVNMIYFNTSSNLTISFLKFDECAAILIFSFEILVIYKVNFVHRNENPVLRIYWKDKFCRIKFGLREIAPNSFYVYVAFPYVHNKDLNYFLTSPVQNYGYSYATKVLVHLVRIKNVYNWGTDLLWT